MYYAGYIQEASNAKKILIEKKFKKIKNQLLKNKIKFSSKIIKGEVDDEIQKYSKSKKADLISLGISGKNFISKVILGSNTLKILRNSKCPVLTVPNTKRKGKYKVKKILLPIDICEKNYNSLKYALDIVKKTGSQITIIYILSSPHNVKDIPPKVMNEIVNGAQNELNILVKSIKEKNKNININKKLVLGLSPSTSILKYAKKNKFNLIILNSNDKVGLERLFLGSVAEEVIRGSHCPILTIKT